jgi:hypothetical protein
MLASASFHVPTKWTCGPPRAESKHSTVSAGDGRSRDACHIHLSALVHACMYSDIMGRIGWAEGTEQGCWKSREVTHAPYEQHSQWQQPPPPPPPPPLQPIFHAPCRTSSYDGTLPSRSWARDGSGDEGCDHFPLFLMSALAGRLRACSVLPCAAAATAVLPVSTNAVLGKTKLLAHTAALLAASRRRAGSADRTSSGLRMYRAARFRNR